MNAERLSIGRVARLADVGVETVRFYEREGLIAEPPRKASGYRQYPEETVGRVRFIRRAKKLGFSLKEIRELLSLRLDRADSARTCESVRELAEAKIADIEERVRALRRMKEALEKLTAACEERVPLGECPILEALDAEEG